MAKTSLGLGSKLSALIISTLLLSGCYKIEITETLNLDGTSTIATEVDMSGIKDTMSSVTENLNVNIEGAKTLEEVPMEAVTPTYTSCSDPLLLTKYSADKLEGPEIISSTLQVKKSTSCALSETEGHIDITIEEADTESGDIVSTQILERKADSCDAPAILAFYQVSDFEEPITEEYTLEKTVEVSCSDSRKEILISTVTSFAGSDESLALAERFKKPEPVVTPDETQAELKTPEVEPKDTNDEETSAEALKFCSEMKQSADDMALFYTGCKDIAPGVGVLNFRKFDTTGIKINSNGTVTYRLSSTTQNFNNKVSSDDSGTPMDNMSASMMGIEMTYIFVSPWPILEHSVGQLTDEYTLTLDVLKLNEAQDIIVTLDTDGSTLDLIAPRTQLQIDNLITTLKERLTASTAPIERQVEYIYILSKKIQKLAALKPSQQVALGYLQTKLVNLAKELQVDPLTELEADFLSSIESLDTEVFAEDEGAEEESLETKVEAQVEPEVKAEEEIVVPEEDVEPDDSQDNNDDEENLNEEEDLGDDAAGEESDQSIILE